MKEKRPTKRPKYPSVQQRKQEERRAEYLERSGRPVDCLRRRGGRDADRS